jgi:hypothetical protein
MTNPVTILNPVTSASAIGVAGNAAQAGLAIGPFANQGALILLTAQGEAKYEGGGARDAGMVLVLRVDGKIVGKDDSFEGESSNISFMTSASHNFLLAPNTLANVEAQVEHLGTGGISNIQTAVSLKCFALAA